jgi:hypothetical protein
MKRIRFSVGGDGDPRSSVWTAWHKKADYYLGVEALTGQIKVSLHRDRRCHVKFQESFWHALRTRGLHVPRTPKATIWTRPITPKDGAVHVASVLFPRDLIRVDAPPDNRWLGWWSDPIFYFAPAPAGEAVEVAFFYTKHAEAIEERLSRIGKPVFYSTLEPSDECVAVVVRTRPFDATGLPQQWSIAAAALYDHSAVGRDDHSGVLFNAPDEHTPLQLTQVSGLAISGAAA